MRLSAVTADTAAHVQSPRHAARRARGGLGRLLPADQVRPRRLLRRGDRLRCAACWPPRSCSSCCARARSRGRRWRDLRERPKWALILAVTAVAAPFLLITFGEHVVPSGLTAVLISPASLFIALLAPFILPSESIDRRQGVGMLLGLAGVALVVGVESVHSSKEFLGALAMIGAAFFYGLSSFVVKGRYGKLAAVQTSWISVTIAGLITLPIAIATTPGHTPTLGAIGGRGRARRRRHRARVRRLLRADQRDRAGARRARLLPGAGRRAVLRRHLPRRGDHGRGDHRPGADPGRRGHRLAAQAGAGAGACARARRAPDSVRAAWT